MKALRLSALLISGLCLAQKPTLPLSEMRFRQVPVPDLHDKPVAEAVAILEKLGLRATEIPIESTAAAGLVVFQDPEYKAIVPVESTVQLRVSKGKPVAQPTVPDLTGLTVGQVEATLASLKLKFFPKGSTPSPLPLGTVVAQSPLPRSPIPDNRTVYAELAAPMPVTRVVPRVIGDPLATAVRTLSGAGLATGKTVMLIDPGPPGIVIGQDPTAGRAAVPGMAVALTISRQAPPPPPDAVAWVPNLHGQTAQPAAAILSRSRLVLGNVTQALDASPRGQIFDQNPPADTRVKPGSGVDVTVSTGGVYIPDVTQLSQAEAVRRLAEARLSAGAVASAVSPEPAGNVVRQNPLAGTLAALGSSVALVISLGPPQPPLQTVTTRVPDVVHMSAGQARETIAGARLTTGAVRMQVSSQPEGTVVDQTPEAGSDVVPGSAIELFISQAPPSVAPVTVPPLTRLTLTQARDILTAASLDLGKLSGSVAEDSLVAEQSPAAYSQVQPHTQIAVTLQAAATEGNRTLWEIAGGSLLAFAGVFAFLKKPTHPAPDVQDLRVVPNRNEGLNVVSLKIGEAPDLALRLTPHSDPGTQTIRSFER